LAITEYLLRSKLIRQAPVIAALRPDRIDAPCLFDGPINGEVFLAYVQTFLVRTLKPGDVVVMDNLGSHRGKVVRRAIRQVKAKLIFLPKYSPYRERRPDPTFL